MSDLPELPENDEVEVAIQWLLDDDRAEYAGCTHAASVLSKEIDRLRAYALAAVAMERERLASRYVLGDAIRRAWQKHGHDSWCSIADDVIAELGLDHHKGEQ